MSDFVSRNSQKTTPVSYPRSRNRPQRHACPFACCDKRFCFPKDLRRHQETHRGAEDRECAVCQICRRSFSRTDNLARHMSKMHQIYPGTKAMPPYTRRTPAGTDSAAQPGKLIVQAALMSSGRLARGVLRGCKTPSGNGLVRETPAIPLPSSPVSDAHCGLCDARLGYHAPNWLPPEQKTVNALPDLQTAPPSDEGDQTGKHRSYPSHSTLHPHQPCTEFEPDVSESVHNYESEFDIGFDGELCPYPPGECPEEACQPAQLPRQSGSASKGAGSTACSSRSKGKGPASRSNEGSKGSAGGNGDGNKSNDGGNGEKQIGPRKPKTGTSRKLRMFRCPVDARCDYVREGVICWSCCMCCGRDSIRGLL